MPEVEADLLIAHQVNYVCDECGSPMVSSGMTLLTSPPQYVHTCENGHRKNLREQYPTFRYKTLLVE